MRTQIVAAGTAGLALALTGALPAAADEHEAMLSVLHGVPGMTVDVWVDGERTLDDFTPGTLAGPLELAPGTYSVAITAADAMDASAPAVGPIDLTLAEDMNYTAVAHLDAAGAPTATLFTNDISTTEAGQGRLTVRHTAAAPAVDVLAGGMPVVTDLTNPEAAALALPAGTVSAAVAPTGTTTPVIGPADVMVEDGVNTVVYAWGSLEAGNLQLAVQRIEGMGGAPAGVPSGELGLAAQDPTSSAPQWMGAGLLLAVGGAFAATRRTASARLSRR